MLLVIGFVMGVATGLFVYPALNLMVARREHKRASRAAAALGDVRRTVVFPSGTHPRHLTARSRPQRRGAT
jgi:hypothetical protein